MHTEFKHPNTIEHALHLREKGEYKDAELILAHFLKKEPNNAIILAHLSHIYLLQNMTEKAFQTIKDAFKNNSSHPVVTRNLSRVLIKKNIPMKALKAAEQAYHADTQDVENILVLGAANGICQNTSTALELTLLALEKKPEYAEAYAQLSLFKFQTGDVQAAIENGYKALSLKPHLSQLWLFIGKLQARTGNRAQAIQDLERGLHFDNNNFDILSTLGELQRENNQISKAIPLLQRAIEINPTQANTWASLGTALQQNGNYEDSENAYKKALTLQPNMPGVINNLGCLAKDQQKWHQAKYCFQKVVSMHPERMEFQANLAVALYHLEEYEQSEAIARKIIDKKPSQPKPYLTLANCLKKADKKTDADKVFNEVLHLFPDSTEILLSYATACQEWGEFSKAENNARAALEKGDCLAEACNILSTVCKFNSIDPVFEKLESSLEENQWPLKNIMHGHFALGNMYANLNKYDQAFTHYSHANKHRHVFFGEEYDEEKDIRKFVTAQKLFTSDYFANRNNFANPTNKPIFIVGMPRSGSTLIEQILGSHSNVFAAGELPYLKQYLYSCNNMTNDVMVMDVGNNFPKFLAHDISKKYLNKITQINNYRPRITDKMPSNFELLWLIALIFPNSTIIHSKRNPVDTCLSCYFQDFIKPHPYKNTLSGLGKYFRYYRNLMDHWEKVLPVTIHDISYEEVVADPENQVKKLLSACDLEFEQGCLDFHKTERSVKTASAYQVRQKIYTSSVQKWRKYEKHLGPLLEALGDYKEWGK